MAEEEKVVQYFSRDFEWEELRDEVERNPKFSYHLSSFSPSLSSPSPEDSDADAWRSFHRRHSTGTFFKERRYLLKEFPELIVFDGSIRVLEVGCGNGSTALPILRLQHRGQENFPWTWMKDQQRDVRFWPDKYIMMDTI